MASYYDEHDCEPESRSNRPSQAENYDLMQLVRSLLEGDDLSDLSLLWADVLGSEGDGLAPPASKDAVGNLERRKITESESNRDLKCPVCLVSFDEVETVLELPCEHVFHSQCILPWLEKTNSCPNCRDELPTDDPQYERRKKEKKEERERELRVQDYHDSMFG